MGQRKLFQACMNETLTFSGQMSNRQSCIKYLGLVIDETFIWGQHVSNLAKYLSKYYSIFNEMKHMIPKRHYMTIFNYFVYSKICYGIEIFGSVHEYIGKRLQGIYNKLLKIFFNKKVYMVQINYIESWILFSYNICIRPEFWNSHLNIWIQLP